MGYISLTHVNKSSVFLLSGSGLISLIQWGCGICIQLMRNPLSRGGSLAAPGHRIL
jgi:hypothetical protein